MQIKDSHLGFESLTTIVSVNYRQKQIVDSNYLIKVLFDTSQNYCLRFVI